MLVGLKLFREQRLRVNREHEKSSARRRAITLRKRRRVSGRDRFPLPTSLFAKQLPIGHC